ncbi:MAG TPA: GNAT family N-acetyltransferase [Acidimicrobiales bacterium]|nr:GNAT family N-acetyltransferase [Acidimicrobiales bacterium]
MSTIAVTEATTGDAGLHDELRRLLPQLSSSSNAPTDAEIDEIVEGPATFLFVAHPEDGGPLLGALTLAVFRIPTGLRAWIEDVVVDEATRGKGIGSELVRAALAKAAALGCRTVDLTSRPSREAANRLYRQLGFVARETNVYRYEL